MSCSSYPVSNEFVLPDILIQYVIHLYVIYFGLGNPSGLLFTCQALQNMQSDRASELHVCFKRSYDANLKHHHTFIIRSAVSVRAH